MPDRTRPPRLDTLSPIPYEDVATLSRNINKIGTAVTRVEEKIDTVKDDLLPPVAKAASEARDGFLRIEGRVRNLEDQDAPIHECTEQSRQQRQDNDIAENRIKVAQNSKLVWWIIGIAVTVFGSVFSFAIWVKESATENTLKIEQHEREIEEQKKALKSIEIIQVKDRNTYLKEIQELPEKFKAATQYKWIDGEDLIEDTRHWPLTSKEREVIRRILENSSRRKKHKSE